MKYVRKKMENSFKEIASLIGEPARASIVWALMDGKALTATELAMVAGTTSQNISMHLAKLIQGDLLAVERQGRHKYYKFSRNEVAAAVEALATLIPATRTEEGSDTAAIAPIKYCRTCYDHLAGKVGVSITDRLIDQKMLLLSGNEFSVTRKGKAWFGDLGISTDDLQEKRRSLLRPCLDWSERRHHIAGSLAAAMLEKMLAAGWIRKVNHSRVILITAKGRKELYTSLKLNLQ